MAKKFIYLFLSILLLFLNCLKIQALRLGENAVQLPVGTKIEISGQITRFVLPDGVLEVTGLAGELGIRAYDSEGKLLYTGKQGRLIAQFSIDQLSNLDFTLNELIFINLKGLSPQPDPPGRTTIIPKGTKITRQKGSLVFTMSNGQKVIFKPQRDLARGDCQVYNPAGRLLFTRRGGQLFRLISFENLRNKEAIDDPTWLIFSPEPAGR